MQPVAEMEGLVAVRRQHGTAGIVALNIGFDMADKALKDDLLDRGNGDAQRVAGFEIAGIVADINQRVRHTGEREQRRLLEIIIADDDEADPVLNTVWPSNSPRLPKVMALPLPEPSAFSSSSGAPPDDTAPLA